MDDFQQAQSAITALHDGAKNPVLRIALQIASNAVMALEDLYDDSRRESTAMLELEVPEPFHIFLTSGEVRDGCFYARSEVHDG